MEQTVANQENRINTLMRTSTLLPPSDSAKQLALPGLSAARRQFPRLWAASHPK